MMRKPARLPFFSRNVQYMSNDQLDFVPVSLSSYRIPKENVSNKASSYAAGGFARAYRATLTRADGEPVSVALKELKNPLANPSQEKVTLSVC